MVFVEDVTLIRDAWVETAARYLEVEGVARRAAEAYAEGNSAPARRLLDFVGVSSYTDPFASLQAARAGDVGMDLWDALSRGDKTYSVRRAGQRKDLYSIASSGPSMNAFVVSMFMLCSPDGGGLNVLLSDSDLAAVFVWLFARDLPFTGKPHKDGTAISVGQAFEAWRKDIKRARRRFSTVDDEPYDFEPRGTRLVHLPALPVVADMRDFKP